MKGRLYESGLAVLREAFKAADNMRDRPAPPVFDTTVISVNLDWGDWTITTIERFTYINSRNTSPIVRVRFEKPGQEDVLVRFDIGKVMFIDAPPAVPTSDRKKELHSACIR